jgi:opacity protein-like surface antigen
MPQHLRFLLSFLFLPFFFLSSNAQEETKLAYGICGGINQANFPKVNGSRVYPSGSMNAPQMGLFVEGFRQNHLNLRMELNYRRKSDDLYVFSPGMAYPTSWDGHYDLDYISLLILPEFRIGGRLEWLVNAGLYLGGLVNAGFYPSLGRMNGTPLQGRENGRSHFPATDGGFVIGSGLSYRITEQWQLGLLVRWMRTVPGEDVQSADYGAMISISHALHIHEGSKIDKVLN